MQINWIQCSDRMPPDDINFECISRTEYMTVRSDGARLNDFKRRKLLDPNLEWQELSSYRRGLEGIE